MAMKGIRSVTEAAGDAARAPVASARRRTIALSLAVLVAVLPAALLLPPVARADIGGCRSDPVVVLSNGVTLDLSAAIADTESDVQQVRYTLHGPPGTFVVAVIPTSGVLGPKETFQFYADSQTSTYAAETVVSTGMSHVGVTATTQVIGVLWSASGSATGWNQQPLRVQVAK